MTTAAPPTDGSLPAPTTDNQASQSSPSSPRETSPEDNSETRPTTDNQASQSSPSSPRETSPGDNSETRPRTGTWTATVHKSIVLQQHHEDPEQAQNRSGVAKQPWWKTRRAIVLFVGIFLLVLAMILLALGLLGYLRKPGQNASSPTVDLGYATYVGTTVSGGINRFLGMRYAAAPVGDLRWRAPAPPPNSTTPQPADAFGPICLGISVAFPSISESEDCLFANVWTPQTATNTSKLPVWLFIQGGGYVSNSNANWDGAEVIQKSGNKVVFVNFNYRVSMWGFLASSKIQANGDLNAGLLDQRFLMQWVRDNIASFGGDPDNVTIHGASAGAGSVALHLTAFGGRDDKLFAAAIAESVFFPAQPFVPQLEYQFDRVANATNCTTAEDQVACLRGLDAAVLQAQNVPSPFPGRSTSPVPLFYWTPCIDGSFLQDLPYNLFTQGKFVSVPLLFGNDNDEGSEFATNAATSDDMINFLQNNYPLLTSNDTSAIVSMYPLMNAVAAHDVWFPSASMAYGEATFICPAISVMAAYTTASAGTPLWNYRYNVIDQSNAAEGLGVPHLWESFAIFGPGNLGGQVAPASYLTYNAEIVPIVMDYFLSFVQTHDPNQLRNSASPEWMAWATPPGGADGTNTTAATPNGGSRIVLETNNTRMETVDGAQLDRCSFWAGLAPHTQQKRSDVDLWGR